MVSHMRGLDVTKDIKNPFEHDKDWRKVTKYDEAKKKKYGSLEKQKRLGSKILIGGGKQKELESLVSSSKQGYRKAEEVYDDTTDTYKSVQVGDSEEYIKNLYGGKGRWVEVPERRKYKTATCTATRSYTARKYITKVVPKVEWERTTRVWRTYYKPDWLYNNGFGIKRSKLNPRKRNKKQWWIALTNPQGLKRKAKECLQEEVFTSQKGKRNGVLLLEHLNIKMSLMRFGNLESKFGKMQSLSEGN